jgi:hypothetical protein
VSDAYVETQYWPAKRGVPRHTLVITLTELDEFLSDNIQVGDHQALLADLLDLVRENEASEKDALDELASLAGTDDEGEEEGEEEQEVLSWFRCNDCKAENMPEGTLKEEQDGEGVTAYLCPYCGSDNLDTYDA